MKIDRLLPVRVIKGSVKMALLSPLVMLSSGCMTALTAHRATHETQIYRQAEIKQVEKVVLIPDGKLVGLFEGKIPGASKVGPFTLTASVAGSNDLSLIGSRGIERVMVPPSAVTEGWNRPEGSGLQPVSVVFPFVLAGYGTPSHQPGMFPGLKGAERTLYVVTSEKLRRDVGFVYVVQDTNPKKTFLTLQPKIETRGPNYPLLLLLPFTVAGDLLTLPVQIIFLSNLGH